MGRGLSSRTCLLCPGAQTREPVVGGTEGRVVFAPFAFLLGLAPRPLPPPASPFPQAPAREPEGREGSAQQGLGCAPARCPPVLDIPACGGQAGPPGRLPVLTLSIGVPAPAKSPKLARSVGTDPADSSSELLSCSPGSAFQRDRAPRWAELPLDPPHSPGESKSQPRAVSPRAVRGDGTRLSFVWLKLG